MGVFYKKIIILLIILSVLIIQCSNEYSGESEKSETEFIKDDADTFVYEESETNIIKTNKTKTALKKIKTKEIKATNESEENKSNETVSENKINEIEKIVYIAKTFKKYNLENWITLRGEKIYRFERSNKKWIRGL